MLLDDLLQHVPHLGARALDHPLGRLDVLGELQVDEEGKPQYRSTTAGRLFLEGALPEDFTTNYGHITVSAKKRHIT
ncbi:MAG TPA: hypothetical protein VG795_13765, partial [Acidimicrobiia bacterium]|nr:hypothetical protein [Acidimicrobiia bacterium]